MSVEEDAWPRTSTTARPTAPAVRPRVVEPEPAGSHARAAVGSSVGGERKLPVGGRYGPPRNVLECILATVRPIDVLLICPAGFEGVVAEAARAELPRFDVREQSSGFLHAQTTASVTALQTFAPTTNAFVLVATTSRAAPEDEYRRFAALLRTMPRPPGLPRKGSLRLRDHHEGTFGSTKSAAAVALEDALSTWSGLATSRSGGAVEFWLIRRRELPTSFLATRVPRSQRRLARGQLRPEICSALARLEPLEAASLVLDPFAGSGAIGEACLAAGAKSVWLNDLSSDAKVVSGEGVRWTHDDFRRLDVPPGSADAIVTDPPWGAFATVEEGVAELYGDFGEAARKWLRPLGAVVLLTGASGEAVEALVGRGGFTVERDFPVLVNGRKARVLRARTPAS